MNLHLFFDRTIPQRKIQQARLFFTGFWKRGNSTHRNMLPSTRYKWAKDEASDIMMNDSLDMLDEKRKQAYILMIEYK